MGEVARPWTTKEPALREQRRPGGGVNSPGVCRNLFGTFDHEENAKFVREELALLSERECQKWNFDFKEETPKKGRFEWTLARDEDKNDTIDGDELAPSNRDQRYRQQDAGTSDDVPAASDEDTGTRMTLVSERRDDREKMKMEEDRDEKMRMKIGDEKEEKGRARSSPPSVGENVTQKQITDFLRKRKNTVSKKMTSSGQQQQQPIASSESDVKVKRRAST